MSSVSLPEVRDSIAPYSVIIAGKALPQVDGVVPSVIRCRETLSELTLILKRPSTALIVGSSFLHRPTTPAFWEAARINDSVVVVVYDPVIEDGLEYVIAGCSGLLAKDSEAIEFTRVIETAIRGELAISPSLMSRALKECRARAARPLLTSREEEVYKLASSGLSNQAIAEALYVSRDTVRWHLRSIHAKLGPSTLHRLPKVRSIRRNNRGPESLIDA